MRKLICVYLDQKIPHDKTQYEVHVKNPNFFVQAETKYDYFHVPKTHSKYKSISEAYSLYAPEVKYLPELSTLTEQPTDIIEQDKPVVQSEPVSDNTPSQDTPTMDSGSEGSVGALNPVVYVPSNFETLEWVEIKSLASNFIQGRFNKQEALAALTEAYAKQK